jgi:hypothetical protein
MNDDSVRRAVGFRILWRQILLLWNHKPSGQETKQFFFLGGNESSTALGSGCADGVLDTGTTTGSVKKAKVC